MSKKTLAPSSNVTARDPKGLKFVSVIEAAYNKAGLSEEEAQRVNEATGLSSLVANFIAENRYTDRFKNEEVRSSYRYPRGYKGPKPIEQQIKAIAEIFDLDPTPALEFVKNLPELPDCAEGWFAIPSVDAVAEKHFPEVADPAERHCCAVNLMLEKLASSRKFYNYRQGELTPDRLRMHERTARAFAQIADQQKGGILIVAGQFGLRHRGRSVRRAREVMTADEFGLGSFAVGCMLLTHPDRLDHYDDLWIDCGGDDYAPDADGVFSRAPCFIFHVGKVEFDAYWVGIAHDHCGSVSASLPK